MKGDAESVSAASRDDAARGEPLPGRPRLGALHDDERAAAVGLDLRAHGEARLACRGRETGRQPIDVAADDAVANAIEQIERGQGGIRARDRRRAALEATGT